MPDISIHELWRIYDEHDKKTGETHSRGLASVFGPHRTIRELKKRCVEEIKIAGRPLAGCALYAKYLYGLSWLCLESDAAYTTAMRDGIESRMDMVGEKEIIDVIENAWSGNEDVKELPKIDLYDAYDEFEEIIKEKYGAVSRKGEFTDAEFMQSKKDRVKPRCEKAAKEKNACAGRTPSGRVRA